MIPGLKNGRGYAIHTVRAAVPAGADGEHEDLDAGPATTMLFLYDAIGMDPWTGGGITAQRVLADLALLADAESIDVRINSPGGDVFEGTAIYNALKRFPGKVNVHVDALAASAATLIAMSGDRISIAENAMFMVHRPWTFAMGDGPTMRRVAELLDKSWTAMLATYQRRTGRRAASIEKGVEDAGGEWWMTAAEAVAARFADDVAAPQKDARAFGTRLFSRTPAHLAAGGEDVLPRWAPAEFMLPEEPRVVLPLEEDPAEILAADVAERDAQERRRRLVQVMRASLA